MPSDSFPRQHARTRRFTLGAPRSFTVSPDDRRVVFLRSHAGDDAVNCLWMLDLEDGDERLVVDPGRIGADDTGLPAEERARRERLRESGGGITAYATDTEVTRAGFALAGRLFRVDLLAREPECVPVPGGVNVFDPRLDPTGARMAFVRDDALFVVELDGSEPSVLCAEPEAPTVSWGSAEFVAAEEMGRLRGFWWSPEGDRLLVARVDTDPVDTWHIASPVTPWQEPRPIRYPAAGTANATVSLWLVEPDGTRTEVRWDRDRYEYLARVLWEAERPLISVQSRDQRSVAMLDVDPRSGGTSERHRQQDDAWVELVAGTPAWAGDRLVTVADDATTRRVHLDDRPATPEGLQVQSVVSADADTVRFLATDDPTQLHVFELTLGDGTVRPLTESPGIHGAVAGSGTIVVTAASLDRDGTSVEVRAADGAPPVLIASRAETPSIRPRPQLFAVGERRIQVAVLHPDGPTDGPLPVLLDPYGGPHALRVQQARAAFAVPQWFADQGFVVVVADGRGTPLRGPAWEREVHGDLAGPTLDDQIDALLGVAERDDRLDLGRVAIRGWSFGGYLAALAVLRRSDIFHAAIAGAPVTEWRLYDTHYTERYLGHPTDTGDVYDANSLIPLAGRLERPLMLIHGLADDNVVAAHTLELSRALLEAGRPHEVLPLSGVTHMTPQESVAENLLRLQVDFLRRALPRSS